MSLFNPVNVAGPAHRGPQIAYMAQNAAQNVLRKQKLRALLQRTTGARPGAGQAVPFRSSVNGRAVGMRPGVIRPGAVHANPNGIQGMQNGPTTDPYADPGPQDPTSLPDPTDPTQSPSSTAPQLISGSYGQPGASGGFTQIAPDGSFQSDDMNPGGGNDNWIPLGNGQFYDPATDTIHAGPGGGAGVRPGAQI